MTSNVTRKNVIEAGDDGDGNDDHRNDVDPSTSNRRNEEGKKRKETTEKRQKRKRGNRTPGERGLIYMANIGVEKKGSRE